MSAFIVLLVRLLMIYLGIKLVWSLFGNKKNNSEHGRNKRPDTVKRFNDSGKNVADGEFEDLD